MEEMSEIKENVRGPNVALERSGALKTDSTGSNESIGIPEEIGMYDDERMNKKKASSRDKGKGRLEEPRSRKKGRKKGRKKEDTDTDSDDDDDVREDIPRYPDDLSKTLGDEDGIAHIRDDVLAELNDDEKRNVDGGEGGMRGADNDRASGSGREGAHGRRISEDHLSVSSGGDTDVSTTHTSTLTSLS